MSHDLERSKPEVASIAEIEEEPSMISDKRIKSILPDICPQGTYKPNVEPMPVQNFEKKEPFVSVLQ
jgi:hypothetical protein